MLEAGLFEKKGKEGEEKEDEEAGRAAAEALVAPFVEAEAALSSLRYPRCDAEPALAWLASKRRAMEKKKSKKKNGISGGFDALEFSLLRAKFAAVLAAEGPRAALRFVNSRMARFASKGDGEKDAAQSKRYLDEIMRLMGAVALFIDAGDGGGGKGEKEGEEAPTPTTSRTRASAAAAASAAASSPSSRRRHRITATNQQRLPARYRDLFSHSLWDAAAEELAAAACELAGVPARPPLLVAAAAGAAALPTLLKLANKMSAGGPGRTAAVVGGGGGAGGSSAAAAAGADGRASAADFGARDGGGGGEGTKNPGDGGGNGNGGDDDDAALPVDLNLGPEFAFTTIFSCPVSRDTATRDNPPMLLPCGHVFCRAAVAGISRGGPASRAFKCPLCPTEATPGSCRALVFPPFGAVGRGGGGGDGEDGEEEEEEEEGGGGKEGDEAMVSD